MGRPAAIRKSQGGYTIVELIAAMAIFAIVLITAIGSFVSVQKVSQKTAASRLIQQDARFNLEQVARQTRAGQVDYNFYSNNAGDARCAIGNHLVLALLVTEAGTGNAPSTKRVYYYYDQNALWSVTSSDLSRSLTCAELFANKTNRQNAANVSLANLQFYISPNADPYQTSATSIVKNTHPRVTVVWVTQTGTAGGNQQSRFSQAKFETTLSTRAYPLSTPFGS